MSDVGSVGTVGTRTLLSKKKQEKIMDVVSIAFTLCQIDKKLNIISRFNSFGIKNKQDVYAQGLTDVVTRLMFSRRLSNERIVLSNLTHRKLGTLIYHYVEKQFSGLRVQTCK
ncbi:hypothetical protein HHI36_007770 [Cryptolaemus montrouzieri]|uniref:Uncharacterized protein n=1 Tax=Cryptolaemus montrouzieri TaxID=559131 RepID=A0ABD2MQQ2_9CUCU